MATFVDSSALYAFVDAEDRYHRRAVAAWEDARDRGEVLRTTSYVLLETGALVQARLGTAAVGTLHEDVAPALDVHWVGPDEHDDAFREVSVSGRKAVSIVDRVSFLVMRRTGIARAFTFDPHFADEGFEVVG